MIHERSRRVQEFGDAVRKDTRNLVRILAIA
jgi:hypothetical protein